VQTEARAYQETWLLLEFCDRGSLQDAMDRGFFRAVRLGASESKVIALSQPSCSCGYPSSEDALVPP
jgi:hypothetical protein